MQRVAGKSARRPARSRSANAGAARAAPPPHADTDGRVPLVRLPLLSSLRDADKKTPLVSFVSTAHGGLATTPAADSEVLGPRARAQQLRLDFATPLIPSIHALPYLYPLGHEKGGWPPWPTIGRPLGLGRA